MIIYSQLGFITERIDSIIIKSISLPKSETSSDTIAWLTLFITFSAILINALIQAHIIKKETNNLSFQISAQQKQLDKQIKTEIVLKSKRANINLLTEVISEFMSYFYLSVYRKEERWIEKLSYCNSRIIILLDNDRTEYHEFLKTLDDAVGMIILNEEHRLIETYIRIQKKAKYIISTLEKELNDIESAMK